MPLLPGNKLVSVMKMMPLSRTSANFYPEIEVSNVEGISVGMKFWPVI